MTGIFNPKDPNALTVRPGHVPVNPTEDRWYGDCSAPEANDGTFWNAQDANMLLAQLRQAIRGMEVAEDPSDDLMLLKAIQAAQVDIVALAANNPIFPEVKTGDNKLGITAGTGEVVVDADQDLVFRGLVPVSTSDWNLAARTLAHIANKTYHLRFSLAGGPVLRDLADSGYNPSAFPEGNIAFDTAYDDMLAARVVTNGSNVATVTALRNAPLLTHEASRSINAGSEPLAFETGTSAPSISNYVAETMNWSRRGRARLLAVNDATSSHDSDTGDGAYGGEGIETNVGVYPPDRYTARLWFQRTVEQRLTIIHWGMDG